MVDEMVAAESAAEVAEEPALIGRATYSPEDNKIRIYPDARLAKDVYARVKAAGFKWAPKQELFVAPMWTPEREDLAEELCGELEDEDTTLAERQEARAERFEGYHGKRKAEADRVRERVEEISNGIPLGQPILVGHHSAKRARKHAEQIKEGMTKAVKLWRTAKYWTERARGALAHAKYKELPAVRHRRIKGLEADRRKQQKALDELRGYLERWTRPDLTKDQALAIANYERAGCRLPNGEYDWSAWGPIERGQIEFTEVARQRAANFPAIAERYERWIEHYTNRISYETAMLGESGGLKADQFAIEKGGVVLAGGTWLLVTKVNRVDGSINSVSTNADDWARVIPYERITDYRPPEAKTIAAAKAANKLAPICNYPGEIVYARYNTRDPKPKAFHPLTQAQWKRIHNDFKGTHFVPATADKQAHRIRHAFVDSNWTPVWLSDAKETHPGKPEAEPAVEPVKPEHDTAAQLEELARREQWRAERELEKAEAEPFERIAAALEGGPIQVVSAPQLFPTPPDLARQVVELADIQLGHDVLEPSAGTGRLLDPLFNAEGTEIVNEGGKLVAIEINHGLARRLRATYAVAHVVHADFLETGDDIGLFDRIIMNPPFANGADIKHVRHALTKLKTGGRLVSIVAAGPRQKAAFEDAEWIDLPAGSFAAEGTGVNAAIVVYDSPA